MNNVDIVVRHKVLCCLNTTLPHAEKKSEISVSIIFDTDTLCQTYFPMFSFVMTLRY